MDRADKKIRVGWVQIGEGFGNQYYLPYSVGLLAGYAAKYLGNKELYEFQTPLYRSLPLFQALGHLKGAGIIFFSVYLWNFQSSLKLAREVKKKSPETLLVFGGPQVPEKAEDLEAFLCRYPFIDLGCAGEGERATLGIIEHFEDRRWDRVPSIGYLTSQGHYIVNPRPERIRDLNTIPSPYLSGVFDELMRQNPGVAWSAMWETNRGCPFTCAFCAWGLGSRKKVYHYDMDRLNAEIDWFSEKKIEFIFCCDANYGMFDRDLEIAGKVAENKKRFGFPQVFSVQNTKNSSRKIFEIQKTLNDAGLQKGVNLALQSLNQETLQYIGRSNIDNKTYGELQKLFAKHAIPTFTDLIIGLPGETYASFVQGVSEIIASGQHNRIKFINLTILENTLMAEVDFQKKHGLVLRETDLIPHHSSLHMNEDTVEKQHLVIATQSLPARDWIKTWVFSWMASLLHFNKLLQIPFIVFHDIYGTSYKDLIETFMEKRESQGLLSKILSAFEEKAASIREGGSEYMTSEKWLNMAWYPDEWMLISIIAEAGIENFYREAEERLLSLASEASKAIQPSVISHAIRLNKALMKQPFLAEDMVVKSDYNIWEIFQAALRGEQAPLEKGNYAYLIDRTTQSWASWEAWCREVIWYGNKRGDYIYSVRRSVQ